MTVSTEQEQLHSIFVEQRGADREVIVLKIDVARGADVNHDERKGSIYGQAHMQLVSDQREIRPSKVHASLDHRFVRAVPHKQVMTDHGLVMIGEVESSDNGHNLTSTHAQDNVLCHQKPIFAK